MIQFSLKVGPCLIPWYSPRFINHLPTQGLSQQARPCLHEPQICSAMGRVQSEAWRAFVSLLLVTYRLLIGWKFNIQAEPTASPWLHMSGRNHSVWNWILIGNSLNVMGWFMCGHKLEAAQIWHCMMAEPRQAVSSDSSEGGTSPR